MSFSVKMGAGGNHCVHILLKAIADSNYGEIRGAGCSFSQNIKVVLLNTVERDLFLLYRSKATHAWKGFVC